MKLVIASDFSRTPGPRYIAEGEYSGEAFRRGLLAPAVQVALQTGERVVVVLDGTAGYGTSFLEEAFGGLIRNDKISFTDIQRILEIVSDEEPHLLDEVRQYLRDADDGRRGQ